MATAIITDQQIRIFLMDKPVLNPLLKGLKWSPEDIDQAAINCIDYFNTSLPPSGRAYTIEFFPFRYLLLVGVAGHLLRSASINQAVNQLDYAVDGVQVSDNSKAPLFAQLGNQFWEEFKAMAQQIKVAQNIAAAFGTVSSEYTHHLQ